MSSSPLNIIFMGTPEFADIHLKALLDHPHSFFVKAVYTQPDRPKGRGKKLIFSPVKETALLHNIPVIQEGSLKNKDAIDKLYSLRADVIVTVAYGLILPEEVFQTARFGAINIHASLLPEYRGPSPIHYSLLNGDNITGVSSFIIEKGVDTGPVLLQKELSIEKDDNITSLSEKLAYLGSECLLETLERIKEAGEKYRGIPQNNEKASRTKKINKAMGKLNFQESAQKINNQIKALCVWPGCHITIETDKGDADISLTKASVLSDFQHYSQPGDLIYKDKKLFICCAFGEAIEVLEVKPAGKKAMSVKAFSNSRKILSGTKVKVS